MTSQRPRPDDGRTSTVTARPLPIPSRILRGRRSALIASLLLILILPSCVQPPDPRPVYHLGTPYQASGAWHYPREATQYDETGLASVMATSRSGLTTNGEVLDQTAMIAAHPTLQLPAIARLTNLETALSTTVRINDRGTGNPKRLVEVSRRTAELLRIPADGTARVRLTLLPDPSQEAAEALPGAPSLAMAAAPRASIEVAELAPPPGVRDGGGRSATLANPTTTTDPTRAAPVLRLPETVTQDIPRPGQLMVRLGTFEVYQFATIQLSRVAGLGARITRTQQGRTRQFRVEIGPIEDTARAESVLDQTLAAGIPDARIVVE